MFVYSRNVAGPSTVETAVKVRNIRHDTGEIQPYPKELKAARWSLQHILALDSLISDLQSWKSPI